jgi:phospholipase C
LMLENRSFDHMLGFLYADVRNESPRGQPFDGLSGAEFNLDTGGTKLPVFKLAASMMDAYYSPGADPGEGYMAASSRLFESTTASSDPVATNGGFVQDFRYTMGWEVRRPAAITSVSSRPGPRPGSHRVRKTGLPARAEASPSKKSISNAAIIGGD